MSYIYEVKRVEDWCVGEIPKGLETDKVDMIAVLLAIAERLEALVEVQREHNTILRHFWEVEGRE